PTLYERLTQRVPVSYIDSNWLLECCVNQNKFHTIKLKRLIDIIASFLVIILILPFALLIVVLIKFDSKGSAFFFQERLGKDGKPFMMIKFRTMDVNVKIKGAETFASEDYYRITRVGYFLRKFRIDELPQFINVLRGDMSLIGPRPERRVFVRDFQKKIAFYKLRLSVRPGISGWAQVNYRYATTTEEHKTKLEYDLFYIKNMSFLLDLVILFKSVWVVVFAKGL
ncbi:MAG: sugar transferase, partial [Candidatus Margulisbacteria bacterium]|nr:sugar transferase [Candidatus Margulisiibacteriota bacterium]